MLQKAARLKGEAEAAAALLEAQKNLRETRERVEEAAGKMDANQEAVRVAEKLEEARAKLRKAEAFKLPERLALKQEVESLERRAGELRARLTGPELQEEPPMPQGQTTQAQQPPTGLNRNGKPVAQWTDADWEDLAVASEGMTAEQRFDLAQALGRDGRRRLSEITERKEEQRRKEREEADAAQAEANRDVARNLRERLTFEKLKEMSNEERLEVAKEVGPAYLISLVLVAQGYWALNVPFLVYAYHETTGQWPDLGSLDSLGSLQAAGAFAGIFAVYALLKPVRLFVALLVTPWTVENVMPNVPWFGQSKDEEKK